MNRFLSRILKWCFKNWLKFLFAISCAGFCAFISYYGDSGDRTQKFVVIISVIVVLVSAFFIDYFCKITQKIRGNQNFVMNILATLFSFIAVICTYPNSDAIIQIKETAAVLSFIFLYFIFYLAVSVLWKYLSEFYNRTKGHHFWIELSIFGGYVLAITIVSAILNSITNLFSAIGGSYDMIFSTDTRYILQNAFLNPTAIIDPTFPNHLFPYISTLPFAVIAKTMSFILFFIPNAYAFCLITMQAVCIYSIAFMMAEMIGLKKTYRWLFIAFFLCLAPSVIFVFTVEEFIIGAFWLVLALFLASKKLKSEYAHSLACGIQTPSILMTPFMTPLFRDFTLKNISLKKAKRDFLKFCLDMVKAGAWILFFLLLTGRIYLLFNAVKDFLNPNVTTHIEKFSGGTLHEKFSAFTHLIANIFYFPQWQANGSYGVISEIPQTTINIFGALLFAFALISFVFNYKKLFAWGCFAWVMVSFYIFVIMGMGIPHYEVFLYSIYFAWAFFALLLMGFIKFSLWFNTKRNKINYISCGILGIVVFVLFVYNILNLVEIFKIGIKEYRI